MELWRRVKCAYLLLSVLLVIGGCGKKEPRLSGEQLARIPFAQREGLPEASGGFVLAVGGETVTADEVVLPLIEHFRPAAQGSNFEQFERFARPQIEQVIRTKVLNILLYKQARRQAGEGIDEALEELAEAEVERFFAGFGGDDAKANEALKEKGMNRQSYKEYLKMMILNQSYMASKVHDNKSITYSELLECYNEVKNEFAQPAVIKFRLIDIEVAKLANGKSQMANDDKRFARGDWRVTDPNRSRLEQARELANELVGRIRAGEDFGELAEEYSGVSFVRINKPVQPKSLAEPYDIVASVAEKMEPNQISRPIETETKEHIFIIKLVDKREQSFEPFEKVQRQVEEKILEARRKKAVYEFSAKLARQARHFGGAERGEFIDFCLEKIYRVCNE